MPSKSEAPYYANIHADVPDNELPHYTTEPPNATRVAYEPWRGDLNEVSHGVEEPNYTDFIEDNDTVHGSTIKQETKPDPEDAQNVFIVGQHSSKTRKTWRVNSGAVDNVGAYIVNRDTNRTAGKLRNLDAVNTLFIAPRSQPLFLMYPVPPNTEFTFTHEDTIYAVTNGPGIQIQYAVAVELEIPE